MFTVIYFHHKHKVSQSFCRRHTRFFEQKCVDDSGGQVEDGQEDGRFSTYSCGMCFPHISYQRQLQFLRYFCLVL